MEKPEAERDIDVEKVRVEKDSEDRDDKSSGNSGDIIYVEESPKYRKIADSEKNTERKDPESQRVFIDGC